jgi:hypothetical protein
MTFHDWALTANNCFATLGNPRHLFIVGDGTKAEYIAQFPASAFGYVYTDREQDSQWNVILEARKWFKRHYDIFLGIAIFPDPNN